MSIKSWLGMCEHQWVDTGDMIRRYRQSIVTPSQQFTIGYDSVRACSKCGAARAFKL